MKYTISLRQTFNEIYYFNYINEGVSTGINGCLIEARPETFSTTGSRFCLTFRLFI